MSALGLERWQGSPPLQWGAPAGSVGGSGPFLTRGRPGSVAISHGSIAEPTAKLAYFSPDSWLIRNLTS